MPKTIRVYSDFDGTLTNKNGEEAFERPECLAFNKFNQMKAKGVPIDAEQLELAETKLELFLDQDKNTDFNLSPRATKCIQEMLKDDRVEFVIVSRNSRLYIEEVLKKAGFNADDINKIVIYDRLFTSNSQGKAYPVQAHESYNGVAPISVFLDDNDKDGKAMKDASASNNKLYLYNKTGKFNWNQIDEQIYQLKQNANKQDVIGNFVNELQKNATTKEDVDLLKNLVIGIRTLSTENSPFKKQYVAAANKLEAANNIADAYKILGQLQQDIKPKGLGKIGIFSHSDENRRVNKMLDDVKNASNNKMRGA